MLLLALAIGLADLLFAFDSIPALFGITTSAWLIVACNAFALSGLRQVYVLLTRVLDRIIYLNRGLAVICAFIGAKLLLQALRGSGAGVGARHPGLAVPHGHRRRAADHHGRRGGARQAGRGEPDGRGVPACGLAPAGGERDVLLRRFAVFDTDGNGVWERADYERLTRRLCDTFGHRTGSAAAQAVAAGQRALFDALLAHMDADGDQQITPDEFTASMGRTIDDRPGFDAAVRAAARTLIQAADEDGNGVLDTGEYARLAGAYGASAGQAARAFAQLDLDRNGFLDTAELAAAMSAVLRQPGRRRPGQPRLRPPVKARQSPRGSVSGRVHVTGALPQYLPSPPISSFHVGPLDIRFYALGYIIGITLAILITRRRRRALGGDPNLVGDIALWSRRQVATTGTGAGRLPASRRQAAGSVMHGRAARVNPPVVHHREE